MADDDPEIIFQEVDPSRTLVRLTRRQWEVHVLTPKPDMEPLLHVVRATVRDPHFANQNTHPKHPYRMCLYHTGWGKPGRLMKVVVDYDVGANQGFVVTAYQCSREGAGEVRIWTKETL